VRPERKEKRGKRVVLETRGIVAKQDHVDLLVKKERQEREEKRVAWEKNFNSTGSSVSGSIKIIKTREEYRIVGSGRITATAPFTSSFQELPEYTVLAASGVVLDGISLSMVLNVVLLQALT
jgi:hypothetical protein